MNLDKPYSKYFDNLISTAASTDEARALEIIII